MSSSSNLGRAPGSSLVGPYSPSIEPLLRWDRSGLDAREGSLAPLRVFDDLSVALTYVRSASDRQVLLSSGSRTLVADVRRDDSGVRLVFPVEPRPSEPAPDESKYKPESTFTAAKLREAVAAPTPEQVREMKENCRDAAAPMRGRSGQQKGTARSHYVLALTDEVVAAARSGDDRRLESARQAVHAFVDELALGARQKASSDSISVRFSPDSPRPARSGRGRRTRTTDNWEI